MRGLLVLSLSAFATSSMHAQSIDVAPPVIGSQEGAIPGAALSGPGVQPLSPLVLPTNLQGATPSPVAAPSAVLAAPASPQAVPRLRPVDLSLTPAKPAPQPSVSSRPPPKTPDAAALPASAIAPAKPESGFVSPSDRHGNSSEDAWSGQGAEADRGDWQERFDGSSAGKNGATAWYDKIDPAVIEERLKNSPIKQVVTVKEYLTGLGKGGGGASQPYIVTFADGMKAVWKPEEKLRNSYAEKAAYDLARLVGRPLVPPTVIREIDGRSGSLQYWVDSSIDLKGKGVKAEDIFARVPADAYSDARIFQYVFGQWDIHAGNIIIDDSYAIAVIDNTGIKDRLKMRYGEQPYKLWMGLKKGVQLPSRWDSADFPFDKAIVLKDATFESFKAAIGDLAEAKNIEGAWKWLAKRPQEISIVLWDNAVWIKRDSQWNGGPIKVPSFPAATVERYKRLTFENLRAVLPPLFSDKHIRDILERRDQIVRQSSLSDSQRRPVLEGALAQ
jgi:hypothetical protein